MKKFFLLTIFMMGIAAVNAQPIYNADGILLKHTMTAEEAELYRSVDVHTTPTAAPDGTIRPVAEYEPCEAVMVRYPFGIPFNLIREMAEDTKVITLVANNAERQTVINQYVAHDIDTSHCQYLIKTTDSYWTRDYGPWFIAIDNAEIAMYDFTYNRPRYNDNAVNTALANFLDIDRYASNMQLTGGNYMNDGTSQAASTTLTYQENQNFTQQQIHQHFQDYLGITNYHFLDDPQDDYIAHIDCWAKFLGPDKVMVAQVPQSDPRYSQYEDVANYLGNITSAYGTPMRVYRVYMPGNDYNPTPYTNSLILNKKVFVPLSGSQYDDEAITAYQQAMPGYEVFGINYNSWENTDALHCRTHEIADREMLYIKHQPLFGEIDNDGAISFTAEIHSYGQHDIIADSVRVFIKSDDDQVYTPHVMTNNGNNIWSVDIAGLPADTIEYYIAASDVSGRTEYHPYIGGFDPHVFVYAGSSSVLGDVNGDGDVNVGDVAILVNHVVGIDTPEFVPENADINGDGIFNIVDIIMLVNMIINK